MESTIYSFSTYYIYHAYNHVVSMNISGIILILFIYFGGEEGGS